VAFVEEEGARFGVPCLGSRLLTGAVSPDDIRGRCDADGVDVATAWPALGVPVAGLGPDPERLARVGAENAGRVYVDGSHAIFLSVRAGVRQ